MNQGKFVSLNSPIFSLKEFLTAWSPNTMQINMLGISHAGINYSAWYLANLPEEIAYEIL